MSEPSPLPYSYLVLEHVSGGELFDYLVKKGRLSEREVGLSAHLLRVLIGYFVGTQVLQTNSIRCGLLSQAQSLVRLSSIHDAVQYCTIMQPPRLEAGKPATG